MVYQFIVVVQSLYVSSQKTFFCTLNNSTVFLWDMKSLHDQCIFLFHRKQDKETWLCWTYLDDFFRSHLDHIRQFWNLLDHLRHIYIIVYHCEWLWAMFGFSLNRPNWADSVIESPCPSVCVFAPSSPRGAKEVPGEQSSLPLFFKPLIGPQVTWSVPGLSLPPPPGRNL